MGSAALHAVLEQLEKEADELFKPRGSTPAINAAMKEYAKLHQAIKAQSLSSRDWGEARRALERTNKALVQLQDELVQSKAERNRLRRIQRALPKIAERREFSNNARRSVRLSCCLMISATPRGSCTVELETAHGALANSATSTLSGLQEQLATITVSTEVLELGETIEALHARLGGHRKAMQDRPHLEAERSQLLTDARGPAQGRAPGPRSCGCRDAASGV